VKLPAVKLPASRSLLPPLAAALIAIAGVAVLWAGLSRTSAFGGGAALVGRLPAVTQPVVVTTAGMSELSGSRFTITATASGGRQVFVGVGRADDVVAYLGNAARAEVTALEPGGALRVASRPGDPALPDPAGVDVWAAAAHGTGTATLTWPRAPGSWRVVVAVDGRTAPSSAEFTWAGHAGSSPAPALIAVGVLLLVAGVAGLLAIRSGRVFASGAATAGVRTAPARARPGPGDAVPGDAVPDDAVPGTGRDPAGTRPDDLGETGGDEDVVVIQPFRRRARRSEEDL
jgi:hypothetical protein